MSSVTPSAVGALATKLLECACTALAAAGRPVCSCSLRHSAAYPSMEVCCDCGDAVGAAWVGLERVDLAPETPQLRADGVPCSTQVLRVTLRVGVHRCVVSIAEDGGAPSDAQMTDDALGLLADHEILRTAVSCCAVPGDNWRWYPSMWVPLGPMGDCAGGSLTVVAIGKYQPMGAPV